MLSKINWIKLSSPSKVFATDRRFWKALSENAYLVTHGRLRIPISLEPFSIPRVEFDRLQNNLLLMISAVKKISEAYFFDKRVREVVVINPEERDLIDSSRLQNLTGIVRVDLFYKGTPQIVEINADFPDGFFMHDVSAAEMIKNVRYRDFSVPSHARLFHRLLVAEGVNLGEHIFVGFDKGRKFIDEFFLNKIKLEEMGWTNVSVGAIEDLRFKNGTVLFDGKVVNVIRRGAELFKLRKVPRLIPHLIEAQRNGAVKVINNFKMRLLGHKSMMAALHDPRFHHYLTVSEVKSVNSLLPQTYKLNRFEVRTLVKEKDEWVIKPTDLAEGEGVSVGKSLTDRLWKQVIQVALRHPQYWIVQRRIEIPETTFNLIDSSSRKISSFKRKYDFDPHIVLLSGSDSIGHTLVRFSESPVLNVTKGGELTYAFIED